ncbi:MAG: ubiquinol-cytochrome c reductase iron-sulfur subunit [Halioglobus sp.]|nr:ubiquinol-cytochrome c reductase iron-sulfur subunit [Halioglobus sp.]
MSSDAVNATRRKFLTAATSTVGAAGAVGILTPFVGSWNPSAKAKAAGAPVKFDVSKMEPGQLVNVEWRGKPVYVLYRTPEQLATLETLNSKLKDPESAVENPQPEYITGIERALRPELLVIEGLCTHLGCAPKFRPEVGATEFTSDWKGGFFCPCHGSMFDLSGRVFSGTSPASKNLVVPPYSFEDENVLVIGVDAEAA